MGHTGLIKTTTNRQAIFGLLAIAILVISMIASTFASAVALSNYSVAPTSTAINSTGVSYTVTFTPEEDAGALVVEFCTNSPLIGQQCDQPVGMDVSTAQIADSNVTLGTLTDNKIVATKAMTTDNAETLTFTGIKNPSGVGTVFARIMTFANGTAAGSYLSETPGAVIDSGAVSMYFTNSIKVSGTVLETLTFCVAAVELQPACANADNSLASLALGDRQGDSEPAVYALTTGKIHEKPLFTQINTNAASGAVVRLRSGAPCGGLMRAGTSICDIAPASTTGFTGFDAAKFGVKLGSAQSTTAGGVGNTTAVGKLQAAAGSAYDNQAFKFNYVNGGAEGVTSTLGDLFLDTEGKPATDQNMQLIFGAAVTNSTPAGTYSTDLNMIAVGKF